MDISRKLNEWRNNLQLRKNIASSCYNCDIGDEIRERDGARDQSVSIRRSRLLEIDRSLKFVSVDRLPLSSRRVHSFTVVNDCVIRSRIGAALQMILY